tara:strand:+ start:528 stop:809 length:282 start_codon:yes stop_codon:yes gene_type:complete
MFGNLPYEINDLIYKHLHKININDLNNEFDKLVENNKYKFVSDMCIFGSCICHLDYDIICYGLGNREFIPSYSLNNPNRKYFLSFVFESDDEN